MKMPVDNFSNLFYGDKGVDVPIVISRKHMPFAVKVAGLGFMNAVGVNANLR